MGGRTIPGAGKMKMPGRRSATGLIILALTLGMFSTLPSSTSSAQQTDRVTGLVQEDGWQLVQANCTECHTSQIIVQNSGTLEVWKSRINWMQTTQGMAELADDVENSILAYLAANYGQKASSRRATLDQDLLPANPYSTDTQ